jgi:hypothetical protein
MGIAGAYKLGPESGRLLVHTTRTGLGAKAGHDLTIEVTRWHAQATVDPATPANSSLSVEVDADSFEVRKESVESSPSDADRAEIHQTLKILHNAQHPTITLGKPPKFHGGRDNLALHAIEEPRQVGPHEPSRHKPSQRSRCCDTWCVTWPCAVRGAASMLPA